MKLAEALIRRADLQKRLEVLKTRINSNLIIQEGMEPAENPKLLIDEFMQLQEELETYIKRINKTNSVSMFDKENTIADIIAHRDILMEKRNLLYNIVKNGSELTDRYSTSEIRNIGTVDVKAIQKEADRISKEYRELDILLQGKNWEIDLI